MSISKFKLISDVEAQLFQGAPSDDSELSHKQIAHWAQTILHDLAKQEIVAAMKRGDSIPPIYITRDIGLEMSEESVADIDADKQRFWVDLTQDVLDLPNDRGIVRVEDYDGNLVSKTNLEFLDVVRNLRFSKPSPDNVLYYRVAKKVFLEGLNTDDIDFYPFIVYYIPKQDILAMDDDDLILVSDQLLPILVDSIVQKGKLQMYGTQADVANDGVDNKQIQYHTAIQNPTRNEPTTNEQ